MTISKSLNNKELTLFLEGRLDTGTAPLLENEINNSDNTYEELVLDFTNIDYISSAGLRVLLATKKKMGTKKFVIKNVKELVLEVFELTGFSEILTIE